MILDGIQQIEMINQGIDWVNIIVTTVSVFLAAILAFFSAQMMNKKQQSNDRYENFVDEVLNNYNILFEIHKNIMSNPFLFDEKDPRRNQKIIEEINYQIIDLVRQHTICIIKSKNIKKIKNIGLDEYFKYFEEMLDLMMNCINYTSTNYYDAKTSIVSVKERKALTDKAGVMIKKFPNLYEKLVKKM